MTDTPSADGLVTEPASAIPEGAQQLDPAAHLDPAAKLNPAKVAPPAAKAKKPKRKSMAKRISAVAASMKARDVKTEAASLSAAASEEHARAVNDERKAAYEAVLHHEVDGFAKLPEDAALAIRLAGEGEFVAGEIAAQRGDFRRAGFGTTYGKALDVGPGGPPVKVDEVWVIAASGDAVKCAVGPISAGGGYHARIPAGHLKF